MSLARAGRQWLQWPLAGQIMRIIVESVRQSIQQKELGQKFNPEIA